MRNSNRLTALKVTRITKRGRYADGSGLYLQVGEAGRSWLFRYMRDGRARAMGLGPVDLVSLADARERARDARKALLDGIDPIEARRELRDRRRLEAAQTVNFKTCAERYIAAHESSWKNAKHRDQWKSTLANYAYPVLGDLPVAKIDVGLVLKVIEPVWETKSETASRIRQRVETVLDWATVRGYRKGDNPARWKGHLDHLLPKRSAIAKVKHHAALPFSEIPQFMAKLRDDHQGNSARALEFLTLTAARTSELTGALWDEIDFATKVWIVPGLRMKAGREHRVPLSDRAIELLTKLPREQGNPYVFIGARKGSSLSNMAMLELMKGIQPKYVPHGLRSTFRDWAAERTNYPNHVVEMALAHTVGDKVEAAYRRGDLFEKRRRLMAEWSRYCRTSPTNNLTNIVTLK